MINNRLKSINDAMPIIGARFYTCLDNAYTRGDIIENDLSKEVENSRLFRLICKLNVVLDRQEYVLFVSFFYFVSSIT
jgi:PAB-dependent poly(A)-specific ribonuclease subunit 3